MAQVTLGPTAQVPTICKVSAQTPIQETTKHTPSLQAYASRASTAPLPSSAPPPKPV
jgi:hypothetical protein